MNHQYVVIKRTTSWEWEDSNIEFICIAVDEEEAEKIVAWLEENDERYDEDNITYSYYHAKLKALDDFESFVKWYDN